MDAVSSDAVATRHRDLHREKRQLDLVHADTDFPPYDELRRRAQW
jgi:hypothetical protein